MIDMVQRASMPTLLAAFFLILCVAGMARAQGMEERVSAAEMSEIRRAFQGLGLHQADVMQGEDGRITLIGEYETRDEVETAFAAARAVVGLRRVAPTTPTNIKYRLKGFNTAFAQTVGRMMQKQPAPSVPAVQKGDSLSSARRAPETRVLIVGANKYRYLPPANWLEGANKDASDFYNFLISRDGGSVPRDMVTLLTNEDAHSTAVKSAMRDIEARTQAGDTVVFFVAAHGLPNALNKFDVVLYDTEFPRKKVGNTEETLEFVIANRKTALSDDDLQGFISRLTAKDVRTVMVMDTCYSGKTFVAIPGYLPSRTRSLTQHKKEVEYTTSPSQEAITDLAQKAKDMKTSRIVIVSASENEESLEAPSLGGGAFTQTYIRELSKERDFADAFDRAKPSVIRIARTLGHSQTPRMLVVPEMANTRM